MKIKTSDYPFLQAIANKWRFMQTGNWCGVEEMTYINKIEPNLDEINAYWDYILDKAHNDKDFAIDYVTRPVIEVFDNNIENADKLHRMRDNVQTCAGIYLVAGKPFAHCYIVGNNEEEKNVFVVLFSFMRDKLIALQKFIYEHDSFPAYYNFENFNFFMGATPLEPQFLHGVQTVVTYVIFKEVAQLQYKEIDGSGKSAPKKLGKTRKDKIVSDVPLKINIMDSTYFTTIHRTDGFKVRGHWRKQRVGKGRSEVREIWINAFDKTGYTRIATIDKK